MKNYLILAILLFTCLFVCSNSTYAQEQSSNVSVTVEELNEKVIYTFVDQRNIPDENTSSFAQRIGNLYPNVETITFDQTNRTFSIHFISQPAEEELNSIFRHFNVYEYTLN